MGEEKKGKAGEVNKKMRGEGMEGRKRTGRKGEDKNKGEDGRTKRKRKGEE